MDSTTSSGIQQTTVKTTSCSGKGSEFDRETAS